MFDLIKAIWPFVSEMFFAGKSLKEVVLSNKLLSALILLLTLSLLLNYFSLGKIYDMASKRREESIKQGAVVKPSPAKPARADEPVMSPSAASSPDSISNQEENHKKLKDVFRD